MLTSIVSRRRHLWALVAILLLAAVTRLHDLATRSLWEDEGWTLVLAEGPRLTDIVQRMAFDQHPPLYFVFLHYWRDLTGSSEFALRMLSVLTGLVAVAGIYQVGTVLFKRKNAGLMAAFLLALSDHHIDLAQDVRHYAQLSALIVLACWYFFRLVTRERPTRADSVGYFLSAVGLVYSHYLGGFVLACQFIYLLIFVRPVRRLWWGFFHFVAIGLAFLPWLGVMYQQNQVRWVTPLYYLNSLPNSHATYVMLRDALLGKQYGISLAFLALGLVWVFYQGQRVKVYFRPLGSVVFLVAWIVLYVGITWYSNSQRPFLTIRNFIVVTPAIALLMGHGLANLQVGVRSFMVAVLLVMGLSTVDTRQLKVPWRDVFGTIAEYHRADEAVLMDIWVGDFPGRYYVEQQIGAETDWLSIREAKAEYVTQFLPVLKAYIQEKTAFWLVYWQSISIDDSDYADIFVQAGFERSATLTVEHAGSLIYIYRYDKRPDAVLAAYYAGDEALFKLYSANVERKGRDLRLQLLWSAEQLVDLDYSVSVILFDANGMPVWSVDGQPLDGKMPTTRWGVGQLVFDQYAFALGSGFLGNDYTIGIKLYYYQNAGEPLKTMCAESDEVACDWAIVGEVEPD